ncbi:UNVERIFIED_CONTAM: hypothetical protein Sradi_0718400 [Sesamum radiatum]|uniref:Myb/SANT-like domain-containing protein n=1 Tax=Sesamum radiatum TaxID=300843 RepID=A0AAW2VN13_SESRA
MVNPRPRKPQKRHFYSGRWTAAHDRSFIGTLYQQALEGHPQNNRFTVDEAALEFASRVVTEGWHWPFKPETYRWRLERLRTQYITFLEILGNPLFTWNRTENRVRAHFAHWVDLLMGEPKWDRLKVIFGPKAEALDSAREDGEEQGAEDDAGHDAVPIAADIDGPSDSVESVGSVVNLMESDSD